MILLYPKYYCSWVLFVMIICDALKAWTRQSVHDPKISSIMKLFPMISNILIPLIPQRAHISPSGVLILASHNHTHTHTPHTHTHTIAPFSCVVTLTVSLPVSRLMFRNTVTEPVTLTANSCRPDVVRMEICKCDVLLCWFQ